jgi:hypothetical protein
MRRVKALIILVVTHGGKPRRASIKRLPFSLIYKGMDQSSLAQNRRSNRSPMLLSAKILAGGSEVPVILRNLSAEGALIEGADLPVEGSSTVFRRNELTVQGKIVWVEGRYAGIAFDSALEREELLRHVPRPRQRFEPQYRRPGLTSQPLTESDRRMVEMWATPLTLRR